jgi:hypothetical protein
LTPRPPALLQRQNRTIRRAVVTAAAIVAPLTASAAVAPGQGTRSAPTADAKSAIPYQRDSLRIYLMTMGVGEDVYELFGHNALWVHDPTQPMDTVYNWGVFDFRTPGFIGRFMLGHMQYMMAGDPIDATIQFYRSLNRQVWVQELDLTDAEKKELVAFLHWNVRPENATYRYDYYRDNCSTRVRDAIDRVTGGQIRPQLKAIKTNETYRGHTLRLMQGDRALVSGVELLLGRPTDVKLSADETSFLPVELLKHLHAVKLDGGRRSLFKRGFVLNEATRPPEPTQVPRLWMAFGSLGIALAALVLWLGRGLREGRRRRVAAFTVSFLAAVLGILGTIITLLVTITDHVAAHSNENMFMLNPLWLVVAAMAPMMILRGAAKQWVVTLARLAAAIGCGALLIHLIGLSRQPNWDAIGLLLPIELAIAWVLGQRRVA